MLAAYSRLAVPCVPMYASHGFTEGRDESRHFSYRAIRQSDEVCQRYISRVSEQFPAAPDDHNYATMRDLLEFLPFLFLREPPQSPATPLFYSPVRSFVLRCSLVPDSATAPASPLRLNATVWSRGQLPTFRRVPVGRYVLGRMHRDALLARAAEGRGSPQPPRSFPSGSHTVFSWDFLRALLA